MHLIQAEFDRSGWRIIQFDSYKDQIECSYLLDIFMQKEIQFFQTNYFIIVRTDSMKISHLVFLFCLE